VAPVGQYLRFATVFDEHANRRVHALARALEATRPAGVREIYPGYGSVYVEWEDAVLSDARAAAWVDAALDAPEDGDDPAPREVVIPVRYGGLDTDALAAATGLDPARVAELHAAATYQVCALATVGQPMLASTDERLRVPRRPSPRTDVPPLAVAIANEQATIYPVRMPGGWSVIGTALKQVYDPHRAAPFTFALGDRVRFQAAEDDREPPATPERLELLPAEPHTPALRVEAAGALDLVLDGGRLGQAHHGMAQSGPLDARAARLANALAGNPPGTPLIECTLQGPTFTALTDLVAGAAGLGFALEVDGEPVGGITTSVRAGARLRMVPTGRGVRGYLALHGGIEARTFLGSASVDRYGLVGRPLRAGDVLGLAHPPQPPPREMRAARPDPSAHTVLRLRRGPQWSREAERALTSGPFTVATGDRMGVRLEGPEVPGGELLSESPPPGAVQVPGSHQPILLLADRQRSAGYAKPAVLHPDDLPLAAQLRPGERLRFAFSGDHPVPWFRDLSP
jgi:KipI family sensor histidine kinase inhibitor